MFELQPNFQLYRESSGVSKADPLRRWQRKADWRESDSPRPAPLVAPMPLGLDRSGGELVASEGRLARGSLVTVLRSIKWAAHAQSGIGNGLHVDHRRADVFVTHEPLHGTRVVSGPQHLGSEGSA